MFKFFDFFRKSREAECSGLESSIFHRKFSSFRQLLVANNRALEFIADLENTIYQDKPFTYMYTVSQNESLVMEVNSIARSLNEMSGNRYAELSEAVQRIAGKVFAELLHKRHFEDTNFVLPIERLSLENAGEVGGKAANLGEVSNRVQLPVPPGFAITAYGYQLFLDYNELTDLIHRKLKNLDINHTEALMAVCQEIQNRILDADLPSNLESSILQAAADLREKIPHDFKLSVRSSATSEDSEASFAIIAAHYLNFSSRLGYHFTTIDTFCGQEVNDNYITFYFKGGAADIGRRSRRALMISQILKRMGFKIEQKADMVRGEIKKYEEAFLVEKLDWLGRLLGSVRLLDMHLADDRQVEWYVEQFMQGNHQFAAERS